MPPNHRTGAAPREQRRKKIVRQSPARPPSRCAGDNGDRFLSVRLSLVAAVALYHVGKGKVAAPSGIPRCKLSNASRGLDVDKLIIFVLRLAVQVVDPTVVGDLLAASMLQA